MFGTGKKLEALEQHLNDYRSAIHQVANHLGLEGDLLSPDRLAAEICERIDALRGEPLPSRRPGSEFRSITAAVRKISLSGAADILVRRGVEPMMEVFADDVEDLPKILTAIDGDSLSVDLEPVGFIGDFAGGSIRIGRNFGTVIGATGRSGQHREASGFRVEVTLPNVSRLRITGAGKIAFHDVSQDELSLEVSGAGNIEVAGEAGFLEADISGAGHIDAYALSATHGRLSVAGAGSIKATVTKSVRARMSGVGKIKIAGNPPQRDTDNSGVGKIKFVDAEGL